MFLHANGQPTIYHMIKPFKLPNPVASRPLPGTMREEKAKATSKGDLRRGGSTERGG